MARLASPLVVLVFLAGCAGGQHPWSGAEYCHLDPPAASAPGPGKWLALVLRGYDPATRRTTTPAVTCANLQVKWDAPGLACDDTDLAKALLPGRPLEDADVIVSPLEPGFQIVWIVTNRFASGDGLGPAAIVEERGGSLVVRAMGNLRAYTQKVALRLERIGTQAVLVAEGEHCPAGKGDCVRSARIMPLRADYFSPDPFYGETGACETPAWLDLRRVETEPLPTGWRRRYELQATATFQPAALRVAEQVLVQDVDPRQPQSPPRLFRKGEGDRTIRVDGKRMVSSVPPLLGRVIRER